MYAYIKGEIVELTPTFVVLENNGIGFLLQISLSTFEKMNGLKQAKLFCHEWIKEDAHELFGFFEMDEKAIFEQLISVSGIGPNIARTVLSTLSAQELKNAISAGNVSLLKSVKGIGVKTAQRMVLELQDKVQKISDDLLQTIQHKDERKDEALAALVMLGFAKPAAEKALNKIIQNHKDSSLTVEELIKFSLQNI